MISVQLPDGSTAEFPDGTPPDAIKAAVQKRLPPRQVPRTAAQGATLGFSDEIEAGARSMVPGSPPYRETRDKIRGDIDAYRESRPWEALGVEVAGAAVPTAVAAMSGFGTPAAIGNVGRLWQLARMARTGAAEGAAAGVGYSEAETPAGVAADAGAGGGIGSVVSPAFSTAAHAVGGLAYGLIDRARTAMGDRASTAVQAELRRLQEGTGQSMDEVVAGVMDGSIMAENRTLLAAVRSYKSKGGEAGAFVTEQVPLRRDETRRSAQRTLQQGLTPNTSGNVFAAQKMSDEALRVAEQADYKRVFGDIPEVTPEIQSTLQDILQRLPEARSEIAKIYSNSRKLVPLFATRENGAIEITRLPTLEDAEIIRRALADETSKAYRAGSGTLAGGYEEAQTALRGQLDGTYTELQTVRQLAAQRRTVRDQFDEGRKVFNVPADELEVYVDALRGEGKEAALRAFRAGAMDAVRNKMRRQQNIMGKMADPERQEGAVLRILFPEEGTEEVARRLGVAGQAEEMYTKVMHNSMTAPELAAGAQIGSRGSLQDTARMLQGDPMALISGLQRKLAQAAPGLDDRQRLEVVKVLFSQDPDFVRRALTDDTMTAELVRRVGQLVSAGAEGGRRASVAQSANLVGGYYDQMMTPPEGSQ